MADNTVVSLAAMEYFGALAANGLFLVDATGKGDINPALAEVVKALHQVLAGGKIQITVVTPGTRTILSDLDAKKDAAVASLNTAPPTGGPIVFSP